MWSTIFTKIQTVKNALSSSFSDSSNCFFTVIHSVPIFWRVKFLHTKIGFKKFSHSMLWSEDHSLCDKKKNHSTNQSCIMAGWFSSKCFQQDVPFTRKLYLLNWIYSREIYGKILLSKFHCASLVVKMQKHGSSSRMSPQRSAAGCKQWWSLWWNRVPVNVSSVLHLVLFHVVLSLWLLLHALLLLLFLLSALIVLSAANFFLFIFAFLLGYLLLPFLALLVHCQVIQNHIYLSNISIQI